MDGELEGDARDVAKRRPLLATEEAFTDHHIQAHAAALPQGCEPRPSYTIPLTGAQLSRMPKYRELKPMTPEIPVTKDEQDAEATLWKQAFSTDYRLNISVTQMHDHKPTCF
eukprot:655079-Karenia_brevis.AAC.1